MLKNYATLEVSNVKTLKLTLDSLVMARFKSNEIFANYIMDKIEEKVTFKKSVCNISTEGNVITITITSKEDLEVIIEDYILEALGIYN